MAYVYAVCATDFSTGGKQSDRFKFYAVTRSYSSHLFLCTLDMYNYMVPDTVQKTAVRTCKFSPIELTTVLPPMQVYQSQGSK